MNDLRPVVFLNKQMCKGCEEKVDALLGGVDLDRRQVAWNCPECEEYNLKNFKDLEGVVRELEIDVEDRSPLGEVKPAFFVTPDDEKAEEVAREFYEDVVEDTDIIFKDQKRV
jgi:hypothetical protein